MAIWGLKKLPAEGELQHDGEPDCHAPKTGKPLYRKKHRPPEI